MAFPATLDSFTTKQDNVTDLMAVDVNSLQTSVVALETKVGVDGSAVTTSLDYKLKSTSSSDPGHKHTLANSATDVTATPAELNILDGVTASTAELNIMDGVTASTAELNILDGVTATAAEINTVCDGDTAKNNHTHTYVHPASLVFSGALVYNDSPSGAVDINLSGTVGANYALCYFEIRPAAGSTEGTVSIYPKGYGGSSSPDAGGCGAASISNENRVSFITSMTDANGIVTIRANGGLIMEVRLLCYIK